MSWTELKRLEPTINPPEHCLRHPRAQPSLHKGYLERYVKTAAKYTPRGSEKLSDPPPHSSDPTGNLLKASTSPTCTIPETYLFAAFLDRTIIPAQSGRPDTYCLEGWLPLPHTIILPMARKRRESHRTGG